MSESDQSQIIENFDALELGSKDATFVPFNSTVAGRKRYLIYFRCWRYAFRLPEVEALAEIACGGSVCADGKPPVIWEEPYQGKIASPFWFAHLTSDDVALSIIHASMLVKAVIQPFGFGNTLEELHASVAALPQSFRDTYGNKDQTFKFVVDAYASSILEKEQIAIIDGFEPCTQFEGRIDLRNPKLKWWVIVCNERKHASPSIAELPAQFYFGRELALGEERNKLLTTYALKDRRYIGPTSMDTELSFIMCNLGCVKKHSLVMDPNVGTGSMIVAAAVRGAHTLGFDIDFKVIRVGKVDSKGERVNLWTNFKDYGLEYPLGLWRGDMHRPPLRAGLEEWLDTILCDPPYGVRAGGKKSKSVPNLLIRDRSTHIAGVAPYELAECLRDLSDLAARLLVVGGRLVFWIPVAVGYYNEDELPTHPALVMVANCEQNLSSRYGRRLIVMKKIKKYDQAEAEAHFEKLGPPNMAQDFMHDFIYATKSREERASSKKAHKQALQQKHNA